MPVLCPTCRTACDADGLTRLFGVKAHAYLVFCFALARANARMLLNADAKRRSSKIAVRTSRQRSVATA